MKVAIHNGWLIFDNELVFPDVYPYKFRRGRLRLDSISSYALANECGEPVTMVWMSGQADEWRLSGNQERLLDDYFGGVRNVG